MKRRLLLAAAVLGVCACGQSAKPAATVDRDTLTRRQKDSIVSTMPIPGAAKIRDAQKAADRAAERAALFDSIR